MVLCRLYREQLSFLHSFINLQSLSFILFLCFASSVCQVFRNVFLFELSIFVLGGVGPAMRMAMQTSRCFAFFDDTELW